MTKYRKQPPIALVVGEVKNILELSEYDIKDLPVEMVVCSTLEEFREFSRENDVLLLAVDVKLFGDKIATLIADLQKLGYEDKYLALVSKDVNQLKQLSFLRDKAFVELYDEPINFNQFKKNIIRLLDLYERNSELSIALKELEQAKKRLVADGNKIKILTNTVSEPIVFVNQSLMVNFWNSEAESFFGYTKFEVVNESFLRWLVAPKSHAIIKELFTSIKNSGPGILKREQSFIFRNKLGVELPVDTTLSYHKIDEQSFSLVFVIHDKQKEKKLEKETLKVRELREENKLMRELLNHISHELRTPLNAIVGISKTLLSHSAANFTGRQREGVSLVQKSGEQMLKLIKDLLGISQMEANRLELNLDTLEFDKLLSQQKTQTLNLIGKKNIKFVLKRSPAIPQCISGDAIKINQILTNVVGNAVKYTTEGKIVLSSHLIDNKLYFEVSDTGIGIPKDKLNTIFEKFSRVKGQSKNTTGTGLGLHITKKLVDLMNGEISAESTLDIGTTIKIFISLPSDVKPLAPVLIKPEIETAGLRILNYSPNRKLIMAVDNSVENTFIYSILSEQDQYAVMLCKNSKIALSAAREFSPDLMIVKLELPAVHGASIIKELRRRHFDIPVITFSEFEGNDIELPTNTILLDDPISLETLYPIIQNEVKWQPRNKIKGAVLVEDDPWFVKSTKSENRFIEFINTNEELTQIKIGQRVIDYLIIEDVDKNSNGLSFFLNLVNENKTKDFKKIILHHEAAPMKYLVDKISSLENTFLMTQKEILKEEFI